MTEPEFLSHFENVRRTGDGWSARCPSPGHNDTVNSLTLARGDYQPWLGHCQAGCDFIRDVLPSTGLSIADVCGESSDGSAKYEPEPPAPFWTPELREQMRAAKRRLKSEPEHELVEMIRGRDGLEHETLDRYACGIMEMWGCDWIAIPSATGCQLYRRENGEKVIRSVKGSNTKGCFFGQEQIEGHPRLVIAKSPREAMLLSQILSGADVIGLPGGERGELSISQAHFLRDLDGVEEVLTVLDGDTEKAFEVADAFAREVASAMPKATVRRADVFKAGHKDVTDVLRAGEDVREALSSSECVTAEPAGTFWNDDGKIDQSALIDWIEGQGVRKHYEFDRETPTKILMDGRVIESFPDARIRDMVDRHLRQHGDGGALAAMRRAPNVYLGSDKLNAVQTVSPSWQQASRDIAYFYYRNGFAVVTADDIELRPYSRLKACIRREWIKDRNIDLSAGDENWMKCEFGRFVRLVTGKDDTRTRSLVSALGSMLHSYKDPANAVAIIITEEKISDNPEGGSGKGLTARALGHIVETADIDARRLNLESQFALQSVIPGVTHIIHFNDAGHRFQFDRLFPAVTDDLTVERKGQQPTIIPFSDSPKILITTNEVIRGRGGSHERRVFEIEFSDYFNADHTPEDEFGHLLFHDWDAAEWNRFDRLMLYCVQYYLRHGLVPYEHVNLKWKKFVGNTSREFGDFVEAEAFEANEPGTLAPDQIRYDKRTLLERFITNHKQELSPHKFTSYLDTYAKYMGWEFLSRLGTDRDQMAFIDHGAEK